jgi:hypothetical protein
MKQGVYKVSRVSHGDDDSEARQHVGRIAVVNGHTQVLEDTKDGFLSNAFPDGILDDQKQRRWAQMEHSPYFKISTDGLPGDEVKPMDQPQMKPEEVFDIVDSMNKKQVLEVYGENMFLDGARITPQQFQELEARVKVGELHLLPR